jgi:hypothetical protein
VREMDCRTALALCFGGKPRRRRNLPLANRHLGDTTLTRWIALALTLLAALVACAKDMKTGTDQKVFSLHFARRNRAGLALSVVALAAAVASGFELLQDDDKRMRAEHEKDETKAWAGRVEEDAELSKALALNGRHLAPIVDIGFRIAGGELDESACIADEMAVEHTLNDLDRKMSVGMLAGPVRHLLFGPDRTGSAPPPWSSNDWFDGDFRVAFHPLYDQVRVSRSGVLRATGLNDQQVSRVDVLTTKSAFLLHLTYRTAYDCLAILSHFREAYERNKPVFFLTRESPPSVLQAAPASQLRIVNGMLTVYLDDQRQIGLQCPLNELSEHREGSATTSTREWTCSTRPYLTTQTQWTRPATTQNVTERRP